MAYLTLVFPFLENIRDAVMPDTKDCHFKNRIISGKEKELPFHGRKLPF